MLAVVGGNEKPGAADVKKILESVGASLDADESKKLEELVEELAGKDLAEVMETGLKKVKSVGMGGGGGGGGGGAAAGAASGGAAEAAKEESEEEEEIAPAGNLFGDDGDDY